MRPLRVSVAGNAAGSPGSPCQDHHTIGVVSFVDAGSYYENPVPQLGHTLLYGLDLGLRYYTAFGPLRLVATPLLRRSADSPIQVYISLGQAF